MKNLKQNIPVCKQYFSMMHMHTSGTDTCFRQLCELSNKYKAAPVQVLPCAHTYHAPTRSIAWSMLSVKPSVVMKKSSWKSADNSVIGSVSVTNENVWSLDHPNGLNHCSTVWYCYYSVTNENVWSLDHPNGQSHSSTVWYCYYSVTMLMFGR